MYATFNGESRASDVMLNEEHAKHVAAKQNAKAESMGIKARYKVGPGVPGKGEKARDTIPSVWL